MYIQVQCPQVMQPADKNIHIIKTAHTNTPRYMYAYAMSPEPLAQETESQDCVTMLQCNMLQKQFMITLPNPQSAAKTQHNAPFSFLTNNHTK